MNARDYLESIRRIDQRIQDKQLLRQHYQEMATRATSRAEALRISGTGNRSRVEIYGLKLADRGFARAVADDGALRLGVNVHNGGVTHGAVAAALGMECAEI